MAIKAAPVSQDEKLLANSWPTTLSSDDISGYNVAANEQKVFHVDYLKKTFRDFARPNLYKVEFNLGTFAPDDSFLAQSERNKIEFLVKSANIPAFDLGKLEIKRMGERIFVPTNQVYGELQLTFMCDQDYLPRKFLHAWTKRLVYDTQYNVYKKFSTMSQASATISQLDNNYNTTFSIDFKRIWCSSIGEIQLSQDSDSQVVEFPATFVYQSYDIITPDTDNFYR